MTSLHFQALACTYVHMFTSSSNGTPHTHKCKVKFEVYHIATSELNSNVHTYVAMYVRMVNRL